MGAWEKAKDIAAVLKAMGNMELVGQMLDLQNDLLEERERNSALQAEVNRLEEALKTKLKLVRTNMNVYWGRTEDEKWDGPFCPRCWDVDHQTVHLTLAIEGPTGHRCPQCKQLYTMSSPPKI